MVGVVFNLRSLLDVVSESTDNAVEREVSLLSDIFLVNFFNSIIGETAEDWVFPR
jgi:hypothetical protein